MRQWRNAGIVVVLAFCAGVLLWPLLKAALALVAASALYLLVGFFLAGLLRVLVPESKIYRYLGADRLKSVTLASLFGVPLPLCSCSVLPVASSLRRGGASKGATTSFLISTPETGLDSIGITYALLDPIMTVARPVAAFGTAVLTGSLVNVLVRRGWDGPEPSADALTTLREQEHAHQHAHQPPVSVEPPQGTSSLAVIREASAYAFGPLLDDLTPWFIIGFLLSGLIAVLIPEGFFGGVVAVGWLSSLLMLLIGTPMYICAAAATPVAATLIAKGLDPGAALVFLLAGPATNATTMLIVARLLGKRILVVHILGITGCALLLGAYINLLYAQFGIDLSAVVAGTVAAGPSVLEGVATVVLLLLLLRSAVRIRLFSLWERQLRSLGARIGYDPLAPATRYLVAMGIMLLYLLTSLSQVAPGETAWVVRFGRIVQTRAEPGLLVHLPRPFERITRLRTREVRSVELGFFREAASLPGGQDTWDRMQRDFADEAGVLTGEENLLSVTYAVHFDVSDAYAYRYQVAEPVQVVRLLAEWVLRRSVARRSSSEILVTYREALEREVLQGLQQELDAIGSGVRLHAVTIQDVHAAPEVHAAFRDVASALEDKERLIRQAQGYRAEALARSRAGAFAAGQAAETYRSQQVNQAHGAAAAFLDRLQAYHPHPEVTRQRLFYEALENVLGEAQTIFLLGDDVDVQVWKAPRAEKRPEPSEPPQQPPQQPSPAPARPLLPFLP